MLLSWVENGGGLEKTIGVCEFPVARKRTLSYTLASRFWKEKRGLFSEKGSLEVPGFLKNLRRAPCFKAASPLKDKRPCGSMTRKAAQVGTRAFNQSVF